MKRLIDNGIGDEGASALGDALKTNATLTKLSLRCEQQDHKETQQEQGKHNGTWCDRAGNEIGVEGARGLGDALMTNTTLTWLDLGGEQQDYKQTQQESKTNAMARGVPGQTTGLVLKERVDCVMHSRQTQH